MLRSLTILCAGSVSAVNNGLARTPPMGWNSWCTEGHCGLDTCHEDEIKAIASAMQANGMQDAGYEYLNLDDCWSNNDRTAAGELYADPARFPSGLPALIEWLHARKFKFGLYIDAGNVTCRPRYNRSVTGSLGHYEQDARTFAAWQVDYVKMVRARVQTPSSTFRPRGARAPAPRRTGAARRTTALSTSRAASVA